MAVYSWPSLISKLKDLGYSESQEGIKIWNMFEEYDEGCKVHGHLWHLSGMGEAFLRFFLA